MLLRCGTSSSFLHVFAVVSLVLLWSVVMGVLSSERERDHTQSDVVICNWLPARRTLLAAIPLYLFTLISPFSPEVSAGQQMCVHTIGGHCGSDQPWSLYRQERYFPLKCLRWTFAPGKLLSSADLSKEKRRRRCNPISRTSAPRFAAERKHLAA